MRKHNIRAERRSTLEKRRRLQRNVLDVILSNKDEGVDLRVHFARVGVASVCIP